MLSTESGKLGRTAISSSQGFSLVEMMIAIVILTVSILGIAASAGRLSGAAGEAEIKALAVQAVEDRINFVRLDPVYDSLTARYATTESVVVGLNGVSRQTVVSRYQATQPSGKVLDYTTITVTVSGGGLQDPVVREVIVGAP